MTTLRISLFGNIRISHEGWASELKITRNVKSLLAFLLLNRNRIHPREILANLFWCDYCDERARNCLSTTLWRLRRVLEPEGIAKGTYLKSTPNGEIGFNSESDHWLDVAVFEEQLFKITKKKIEAMGPDDVCQLESTLKLWVGELLEGFYDDWALRERERLRVQYLKGIEHLMDYYGYHQNFESAITWGLEILALDPLREEIHRKVMRLYGESGQRTKAIQHFGQCSQILSDELGVEPMEETRALYHRIVAMTDGRIKARAQRNVQPGKLPDETKSIEQAFEKLHLAIKDCETIRAKLEQVSRYLGRLVTP
jgi:DNA-binding SARP family transcriptional activator